MKRNKDKKRHFFQRIIKNIMFGTTAIVMIVSAALFMGGEDDPVDHELHIQQEELAARTEIKHKIANKPSKNIEEPDSIDDDSTDVEDSITEEAPAKDIKEASEEKEEVERAEEKTQDKKTDVTLAQTPQETKKVEPKASDKQPSAEEKTGKSSAKQPEKQQPPVKVKESSQTPVKKEAKPKPTSDRKQETKTKPKSEPVKKTEPKQGVKSEPKEEPKQQPVPTQPEGQGLSSQITKEFQTEVLRLVNNERAKLGLGNLETDYTLEIAAMERAAELQKSFSHTRPDGSRFSTVLDQHNISYRAAGENLAMNYPSPEAVVEGWMNSTGHRANILNGDFNKLGVGIVKTENGSYLWTQLFIGTR